MEEPSRLSSPDSSIAKAGYDTLLRQVRAHLGKFIDDLVALFRIGIIAAAEIWSLQAS